MGLKTKITDLTPTRIKLSRIITLPSKGAFNKKVFTDGKLQVFPWTSAVDEWFADHIRGSQPKERSKLIYELAAHLCDRKGVNIEEFYSNDPSAILLNAKAAAGHGLIKVSVECPKCGHTDSGEIPIDKFPVKVIDESKPLSEITLGKCGDLVTLRPLQVKDDITAMERPAELELTATQARVVAAVVSVGGGRPENMRETAIWYTALEISDQDQLRDAIIALEPTIDTGVEQECSKCKHKFKHMLLFDQNFFRA